MATAHKKRKRNTQVRGRRRRRVPGAMLFTQHNYALLLLGILAIVVGYAAMRIENEVDGILSLYIAPILILGGYLEIIYAILWRPGNKAKNSVQ